MDVAGGERSIAVPVVLERLVSVSVVFFFFQAEDGIRDLTVTGVQTCALPIALPGGMLTSSPVRGLRPMPVLRGFTLKTPKRRSSMRWPRPRACFNDSKTVSTACSALVRLMFVVATTAFTISSLITRSSRASEPDARGCGAGCQGRGGSSTLNIFWRSRSNHFGVATDRRDRSKVISGGMDGRQARPMDPAHVAGAQDDRAVYGPAGARDRKSTRLNSSHSQISYAVFCLKKKKTLSVLHQ